MRQEKLRPFRNDDVTLIAYDGAGAPSSARPRADSENGFIATTLAERGGVVPPVSPMTSCLQKDAVAQHR